MAKTGDWHAEDIKAAIRKRGVTMTDLALSRAMPEASVRNAIARPFAKGELVIAEFLQIPLHEIWPNRWTKEGKRLRPRYVRKHSTQKQGSGE